MRDGIDSVLLGTAGLSLAAAVAGWLAYSRSRAILDSAARRNVVSVSLVAVACHSAHFAEELTGGFPARFPALLGLEPWSISFFASFNLLWILIWIVSCWGVSVGARPALFPLWFLGIASVLNAVAHPLLSAVTGGYFPGLFTSPVAGVAGLRLVRQLERATSHQARLHDATIEASP
jgi:hypothetical protein